MTDETPARVVYVTPSGEHDEVADRLVDRWPSLSLLVADGVESALDAVDPDVDAVVTYQDLPDGTGLDIQRSVNPTGRTLPVVLLADGTTPETAAAAVNTDLAGYLPTGDDVDVDRLAGVLEDVIGERPSETATVSELAPRGDQSMTEWKALLLDQLFTRLPVHLYVKDREGRHVLVSEAFVDDPEEYLGRVDADVGYVTEAEAGPAYEDDMHVIETGEPIIDEEEYYASTDRWFLTSKVPLYGPDGEITGLIGVSRDITDRKEAERELVRSNERLDRFASVVSHDVTTPLNVIENKARLIEMTDDPSHASDIYAASERVQDLVDQLGTLARQGRGTGETEPVSLERVAEECWQRVDTGGASLSVTASMEFLADPTRTQQLLENLFRNAVEHGSTSPRSQTRGDPAVAVTVGALDDAGGFFVADDGPGIPPEDREAAFDPGYTTGEEGTGFGLSIVRKVARDHGWSVAVTEGEAGGARFEIRGVERPADDP